MVHQPVKSLSCSFESLFRYHKTKRLSCTSVRDLTCLFPLQSVSSVDEGYRLRSRLVRQILSDYCLITALPYQPR